MAHLTARSGYVSLVERLNRAPQGAPPSELLHAILKMPVSRTPDYWQSRHGTLLRIGNYWALVMEPVLFLMFVLPANSPAKWFFILSAAAFHIGDTS